MSSVEDVASYLTDITAALPSAELDAAAAHLTTAYQYLSGIDSEKLTEVMHTINNALASTQRSVEWIEHTRANTTAYLADIGVGEVVQQPTVMVRDAMCEDIQHDPETSFLDDLAQEILIETLPGRPINNRAVNELLARARDNGTTIRQALCDPARAAGILSALTRLQARQHEPYASFQSQKTIRLIVSELLYSENGEALRAAATQIEYPDIADQAMEVMLQTYTYYRHHAPETTTLLVERFMPIFNHYAAMPPATPGYHANIIQAAATCAHVLIDGTPKETSRLLHDLRRFGATATEQGRHARNLYTQAIRTIGSSGMLRYALFRKAGLDEAVIQAEWKSGNQRHVEADQYLIDNAESVIQLEAAQPGTCKKLSDNLDVRNFARYSIDLLQGAYRAIDNPPANYILFISGKHDGNGALSDQKEQLDELRAQLKKEDANYEIIPVELDKPADAQRTFRRLYRRGWKAAQHAILNAHGASDGARLGTERLSTHAIHSVAPLLRLLVVRGGTMLLMSCSTGKGEESLAKHVADTSGRNTYAPGEDIYIKDLTAVTDPQTGRLVPRAKFGKAHTTDDSPTLEFLPT